MIRHGNSLQRIKFISKGHGMWRFLAFDCETGGLDHNRSLLTVYFVAMDENFRVLGELDLKIKPDNDDPYLVDAGGLGVNGIDLVKHDEVAIPMKEAKRQLYDFLSAHKPEGKGKLIPIGQNIYFDIDCVLRNMLSKKVWDNFVSYHPVDTAGIATVMKLLGIIPRGEKTRLTNLCEMFDVPLVNAHDAKADTMATVKVLKVMLKKLGGNINDD